MLCQCGEREATIHEVVIRNGRKSERHLCEVCAKLAGVDVGASGAAATRVAVVQGPACESCGTSLSEFKHTGLLGCPACYRRFETQLTPLLERAHEGGTHHVGKFPRRLLAALARAGTAESMLGDPSQRAARLGLLRQQLDEAVGAEQYERAAKIRDEISRLADPMPPASGVSEPTP
jgi:protein arginine kinase activator